MLKYICVLALALLYPNVTTQAKVEISVQHKTAVYFQILKNHPKIDKEYAQELAYLIQKIASVYKVKARNLAAIYAQESMYKLNSKNCDTGHCTDFGISQIHYKTVKAYGFDKHKLLTDLEYSIEAGAIVLSDIKKIYGAKDPEYWSRYNSSNPNARAKYKKLVMRYM